MCASTGTALLAAACAAASPGPAPAPSGQEALVRIALVAGANDGGAGRPPLRYARSDAEAFARLMQQMGGVAPDDTFLVLEPSAAMLRAAFDAVRARVGAVRGAARRVELLLYYSGHSDEDGLLLRGERIRYPDLRRWLDDAGAEVRIAILDSCASGAITREKGGARAASFLVDSSNRVSGHAFLTSSAEDEASQESDRIGASFFTHFLVSGLRGAADASGDGRVTLSEAYEYAFDETLARTEKTRRGAQHPAYDIQLVGSGDVVMTDLRGTGSALVIPERGGGRFFVRDATGRLAAELRKVPGRGIELGLEPGEYQVTVEDGGRLTQARVTLAPGARTDLPIGGFVPVPREATASRGDLPFVDVPFDFQLYPALGPLPARTRVTSVQVGLIGARATSLRGLGVALGVLLTEEDVVGVQAAGASWSGGEVRGAQFGVANGARSLVGLQNSQIVNVLEGDGLGAQISSVVNWTEGRLGGLQLALVNRTGGLSGAQVGLVNLAHQAGGAQVGLVDVAERADGAQVALVGVAGEAVGAQVSLVNVGGEVRGLQLGLANVAGKATGLQLGLVNVAREADGLTVGLLNLIGNGIHDVELTATDRTYATLGVKLGGPMLYTALTAGAAPHPGLREGQRVYCGIGLGYRYTWSALSLDVDGLLEREASADADDPAPVLRATLAWRFVPALALVAGKTVRLDPARDHRAVSGFMVGLRY